MRVEVGWGGDKEDVRFCDLTLERKPRYSERVESRFQRAVLESTQLAGN